MDKDNLERAFKEWKPGQTGDVIEKELFQMYRFQPVNYWMKMSQYPRWSELVSHSYNYNFDSSHRSSM